MLPQSILSVAYRPTKFRSIGQSNCCGQVKHELQVQIYELKLKIHELRVQTYELRDQIQELRVQIHELGD